MIKVLLEKQRKLLKENEKLKSLIMEILRHDIGNLGKPDWEFFRCYTYEGKMPKWVNKAKKLVGVNDVRSPGIPSVRKDSRKSRK